MSTSAADTDSEITLQTSLTDLEAKALPGRLNSMAEAEVVLLDLEEKSPFVDPADREVWVSRRLLAHMWEKIGDEATYRERMSRMTWVRPTIEQPCEVWENKDNRPGRVYLGCFIGYDERDAGRCQFLALIVKNKVFRGEDGVVTMYPFRRAKEVEVMRRSRRLWP